MSEEELSIIDELLEVIDQELENFDPFFEYEVSYAEGMAFVREMIADFKKEKMNDGSDE